VVLRAYLDGSETESEFLTLACIAATDDIWGSLENAWETVRMERGNPSALHMTEAMSLNGEFANWSAEDRDQLVEGFLGVLEEHRTETRLRTFTCTVNLASHGKWKSARRLPSPARLCARIVFPHLLEWYWGIGDLVVEPMDVVFDRNEPFMRHLDADWKNPQIRKRYPVWNAIRCIHSAVASDTPALQLADMVAWGRNRFSTYRDLSTKPWETDKHYIVAHRCISTIAGIHREVGEAALSSSTFEEEGFELMNAQRKRQLEAAFLKRAIIRV